MQLVTFVKRSEISEQLLFGSLFYESLNLLLKIFDDWIRHHGSGLHGRGLNTFLDAHVLHAHLVNVIDHAEFNLLKRQQVISHFISELLSVQICSFVKWHDTVEVQSNTEVYLYFVSIFINPVITGF